MAGTKGPEWRLNPQVCKLREQEIAKYDGDYFKTEYWKEDLTGQTGNRGLSYDDPLHTERFDFLYKNVIVRQAMGPFLDAGCGPGQLFERALLDGKEAYGCDVSQEAKALFEGRVPERFHHRFTTCSLTSMPFQDRAFSLTVCLDVLEHLLVFDIFDAVRELHRVTDRRIIVTINLDNPYRFHPTVLSRGTWICLFEAEGSFRLEEAATGVLQSSVSGKFPEYDFFVFDRTSV